MQNWMANNILKLTTNNMDAQISVMATPEYANPQLLDEFN
jgi:hypothetical protein